MERDFDFGGRKFKLGKMSTFKQFHIVRRIAPILAELLPALQNLPKVSEIDPNNFETTAKIMAPMLTGFSKLSDQDSEFVLYGLLSSVEVNLNGAWVKVATDSILMMQDMELPSLLQIAGRAFMFNLSSFFAALPTNPSAVR